MRDLIVPELRKRYPTARIIHELPLRYSTNRIDLAAVTETEIVSVEIKSSKDVADRLEAQLRAFAPVSTRIIVALAPKWNEQLPSETTERNDKRYGRVLCTSPRYTECQEIIRRIRAHWIETWTVDTEAQSIKVTAGAYGRKNRPWLAEMLDMLHVAEIQAIAEKHRIAYGKRPTHDTLVSLCTDLMTGREITAAVCAALRARPAFAQGTDAPVGGPRDAVPPIPAESSQMFPSSWDAVPSSHEEA